MLRKLLSPPKSWKIKMAKLYYQNFTIYNILKVKTSRSQKWFHKCPFSPFFFNCNFDRRFFPKKSNSRKINQTTRLLVRQSSILWLTESVDRYSPVCRPEFRQSVKFQNSLNFVHIAVDRRNISDSKNSYFQCLC